MEAVNMKVLDVLSASWYKGNGVVIDNGFGVITLHYLVEGASSKFGWNVRGKMLPYLCLEDIERSEQMRHDADSLIMIAGGAYKANHIVIDGLVDGYRGSAGLSVWLQDGRIVHPYGLSSYLKEFADTSPKPTAFR